MSAYFSYCLVNKLLLFQSFVYSLSYKVVAVIETWLSDRIYDREILPNGFMINNCNTCVGGVMLAVHNLLSDQLISSPPHHELVLA